MNQLVVNLSQDNETIRFEVHIHITSKNHKVDKIELTPTYFSLYSNIIGAMDTICCDGKIKARLISDPKGLVYIKLAEVGNGIPVQAFGRFLSSLYRFLTNGTGIELTQGSNMTELADGRVKIDLMLNLNSPEGIERKGKGSLRQST